MSMFLGLALIGSGGGGGASSLLPQIQAMFGGGEQGVIYDVTDPLSLFQERTGASATTPSGSNGPIGTLKDLSPNNNWSVAPSDAARCLSRQGVGAPNVYGEFDGVDDSLKSLFVLTQPFTRISSWRAISSITAKVVFQGAAGDGYLFCPSGTTMAIRGSATLNITTVSVGSDVVFTERLNGASSSGCKNNEAYTSGTAGVSIPGGMIIGSELNQLAGFSNIRLYRVVLVSRLLTDPEIAICRTWCGEAAGLVL